MTSSYVELSSQAYGLIVDAVASANQRALDYAKSLFEIAARPYASMTPAAVAQENFDRAHQIVARTVGEFQTTGQKSAEFAEKAATHGAKLQETYVAAMRGVVNSGISNMNFVKETTDRQMDDMAKRFDEIQNHATATISNN
ncbi:MAG: hypothetical protein M3R44_02360 [Candidatus Eremiobacteraeota bacterium]|nr:hypothetical protein [Candidatus Eremiobacteraeota bacterium]